MEIQKTVKKTLVTIPPRLNDGTAAAAATDILLLSFPFNFSY